MIGDKIILAQGCEYNSDTSVSGINNNQIIVGGSGSGKTMSITEPCLLHTQNRSLVVTVTKKRIVEKYIPILEDKGYDIQVLDFTDPYNCTVGYDPMNFIKTEEDIAFLAKSLVMANPFKGKATGNHSDPYWDEAAIGMFSALIGIVNEGILYERSFVTVIDLFKSLKIDYSGTLIKTNLDKDFSEFAKICPESPAVANWESFRNLPPKTASCIMSTLSITINYLFDTKLHQMMKHNPQVYFWGIATRKTVLFIITSPVNQALSNLVSVFYSTALKELFEYAEDEPNGKLPVPVHIICDDFATGAPIPNFAQYISIIREKDLSATILCQSETQLETMYSPSEAITIINNCDTYVYTGSMDIKTARNVGERINKPADEILSLPIGKFIIFRRGEKPKTVSRYPILEDPEYARCQELLEKHKNSGAISNEKRNIDLNEYGIYFTEETIEKAGA